jgi:hypothetical protein
VERYKGESLGEQAQGHELQSDEAGNRASEGRVAELTSRAPQVDAQEDAEYGPDNRGDEIPEELRRREQRLGKIQEAIERLRSRQAEEDRAEGRKEEPPSGEPPERKQDNFTDPESRIMKTSSGFDQCYNGQLAVESESRLIVAAKVTQSAANHDELLPVLEEVRSNVGQLPQAVLADAGYRSEENFAKLEASAMEAYVALGRERKAAKVKNEEKYPATHWMKQKLKAEEGRQRYSRERASWNRSTVGSSLCSASGNSV